MTVKIAVLGLGHVGLTAAAALAVDGHQVLGYDTNPVRVRELQAGVVSFHEAGLEELVISQVKHERLSFTDDPELALFEAEVVFICVGTPGGPNGEASLVAVEQACQLIAKFAPDGVVVVEKSTVPAGTSQRIEKLLSGSRSRLESDEPWFYVVSNPEFLREGTAVQDALKPTRIVVGAESDHALEIMSRVYQYHRDVTYYTDVVTAELAKHACNSYLATRISFINGIARMCEAVGANVRDIQEVMGLDPRIGSDYLTAGIGYGGYCLPKDVQALSRQADSLGVDGLHSLLESVDDINAEIVDGLIDVIRDELWNLDDKRVAVLGIAFKPGTDDTRDSPALELMRQLREQGAEVHAWDPEASQYATHDGMVAAMGGADCVVIATAWPQIAESLPLAMNVMKRKLVVDAVGLMDPKEITWSARLPYVEYRTVGVRK